MQMSAAETVTFREVAYEDLRAICDLDVKPEQKGLVTANVMTMAEAPFEPGALVRGIWAGDSPAGLLAMIRPSVHPEGEDITIRRDAAYVWRLMVGAEFQGRGLGVAALDAARETAVEWGYRGLSLTAGDSPHSAIPFYERYGFVRTGRALWGDDGEQELVCWFNGSSGVG